MSGAYRAENSKTSPCRFESHPLSFARESVHASQTVARKDPRRHHVLVRGDSPSGFSDCDGVLKMATARLVEVREFVS